LPCLPQRYTLLVGIVVHAVEVACAVLVVVKFWVHVCAFIWSLLCVCGINIQIILNIYNYMTLNS
jgi:hypothetical protein